MGGNDSGKARGGSGNVRVLEWEDVLVGPKAEEVRDISVRIDQHEGYLHDIEGE